MTGSARPGKRLEPEDVGFGRLFDIVSEAVVVGDASSGEIVLWNAAAQRLFGYTADEAVGMPMAELVPDELREAHRAGIRRYSETGVITLTPLGTTVEVPARRRDGTSRWVELSLVPLPADVGEHLVLALLRDVTDRHDAEQQLVALNQTLREFVATTAHDLRAPIGAVRAAADTLLVDAQGNGTHTLRLAQMIERQATSLGELVDELLEIAALEAGGVPVRTATVTVRDAIVSATEAVPAAAASIDVDPAGLVCRVDTAHFRRILVNLLANAVAHGAAPITVTASRADDVVRVRVCDAGAGVPDELLPRLFQKFAKGPTGGGTGLGLAIAAGLAAANGGELRYEEGLGKACFALRLPAA